MAGAGGVGVLAKAQVAGADDVAAGAAAAGELSGHVVPPRHLLGKDVACNVAHPL